MPGDEDDAVARQLARQRHRLIGVAEVVADDQLDLLAEHAALGVEILDRHLGAALIPLAGPGVDAGHRAGRADPDLGLPPAVAQSAAAEMTPTTSNPERTMACLQAVEQYCALVVRPPQCGMATVPA